MGIYAEFRKITETLTSLGITSSMKYKDLHRAIFGFFKRLKFDVEKAFSCPTHGNNPRFLNTDGKNLVPTKRKVSHLSEHKKHPDDNEVLPQSTLFDKRVFLRN